MERTPDPQTGDGDASRLRMGRGRTTHLANTYTSSATETAANIDSAPPPHDADGTATYSDCAPPSPSVDAKMSDRRPSRSAARRPRPRHATRSAVTAPSRAAAPAPVDRSIGARLGREFRVVQWLIAWWHHQMYQFAVNQMMKCTSSHNDKCPIPSELVSKTQHRS